MEKQMLFCLTIIYRTYLCNDRFITKGESEVLPTFTVGGLMITEKFQNKIGGWSMDNCDLRW